MAPAHSAAPCPGLHSGIEGYGYCNNRVMHATFTHCDNMQCAKPDAWGWQASSTCAITLPMDRPYNPETWKYKAVLRLGLTDLYVQAVSHCQMLQSSSTTEHRQNPNAPGPPALDSECWEIHMQRLKKRARAGRVLKRKLSLVCG